MTKYKQKYGIGEILYDKRGNDYYRCKVMSIEKDCFKEIYGVYYTNKKNDFSTDKYFEDDYCIDFVSVENLFSSKEYKLIKKEIEIIDKDKEEYVIVSLKHSKNYIYSNSYGYPLWGDDFNGYTTNIHNCGIYSVNEIKNPCIKTDKIVSVNMMTNKYYAKRYNSILVNYEDYKAWWKTEKWIYEFIHKKGE